jgi:nitrogen fixation/metabolism regulation signal transduction histidine kinase
MNVRTRVTVFFFVAALPAALVSAAAVVVLDRFVRVEIKRRADDVAASAKMFIENENERVRSAVEKLADSDELRRTVIDPLEHGEPEDDEARIEQRNAVLADGAASFGLDILALVSADARGRGTIIASAHLRTAVGDDPPRFAVLDKSATATAGFAHELVAGNPPAWAPAVVAVRAIPHPGEGRLFLYGGSRLDTHRLESIATNGRARLVLDSPRLRRSAFPAGASAEVDPVHEIHGRTIVLRSLPHGRDPTPAASAFIDPNDASQTDRPTRIYVFADIARLERARSFFLSAAAAIAVAALLMALTLGAYLSRRITTPIVELSHAAQAIGAGNLDVQIEPRSSDEVGALVEVFNQMTRELADSRVKLQRAERIAAWREIARRVAHEIKNPLFPIQMAMETLRKGFKSKHPELDEIVEESTRTVLEEVRSLNRIVTEFSDFARLPAPRLEPLDVKEILDHVASLYGSMVRVEAEPGLKIEADREQIGRALINLVKNAVEAMPPGGGTVTLSADGEQRDSGRGVRVDVADTGSGIAPEVLKQIFTPYFTTKKHGTGLGLAIVERIVQEHRGAIDVESKAGVGTTFRVWLPSEVREA